MPLSFLLALPIASTAAVAAFAKPLLGAATVLALIWSVAVLVLEFGRT